MLADLVLLCQLFFSPSCNSQLSFPPSDIILPLLALIRSYAKNYPTYLLSLYSFVQLSSLTGFFVRVPQISLILLSALQKQKLSPLLLLS